MDAAYACRAAGAVRPRLKYALGIICAAARNWPHTHISHCSRRRWLRQVCVCVSVCLPARRESTKSEANEVNDSVSAKRGNTQCGTLALSSTLWIIKQLKAKFKRSQQWGRGVGPQEAGKQRESKLALAAKWIASRKRKNGKTVKWQSAKAKRDTIACSPNGAYVAYTWSKPKQTQWEKRERERDSLQRLIGIYSWHSRAAVSCCKFESNFQLVCAKFNEPKPFALRRLGPPAALCSPVPHYVIGAGPLRTWVTLSAQSFTRAKHRHTHTTAHLGVRLRFLAPPTASCQGCVLYIFHNH